MSSPSLRRDGLHSVIYLTSNLIQTHPPPSHHPQCPPQPAPTSSPPSTTTPIPSSPPTTPSSPTNKHVFITGASKGIGRSIALSYARAGVSIIGLAARSSLSDLESEILAAAREAQPNNPAPKVHTYKCDVLDNANVEAVANQVRQAFNNRLDILVNNAGYLEEFKPLAASDPQEWWHTWTINLRGPYLVTRAFLPLLLEGEAAGDKTIVNVSSVGAHLTMRGASSYQMSKLALLRFTEFVVKEYGDRGVVAFAVDPGGVRTELAGRMPVETHGVLIDQPELAGDTIAFLTREKREWLAGRYVDVTWDMEEFLGKREEIVERDLLKVRMAV